MENRNKKTLKEGYRQWDGIHMDYLKNLYQENRDNPSFIPTTVALLVTNEALEIPTSWVVKHHVDKGETLAAGQVAQLVKKLDGMHFWESQLHLLQIIPKITITATQAEQLEPSVRNLLSSERAFVKAAAFAAYFEIVQFIPELKNEFRLICEDAWEKSSASVKVKIRRILKRLPTSKNG